MKPVLVDEADYWLGDDGIKNPIELDEYIATGQITVIEMPASAAATFRSGFEPNYFEKIDVGELESLAFLVNSDESFHISSGDKAVYKVLGNLGIGEQGVSLQEVLDSVGLSRTLPHEYCKDYREKWTGIGAAEGIQGILGKKRKQD